MSSPNRFQRQVKLKQIGEHGQNALRNAHVLIVGLGGLGSTAAIQLASGGVGKLTLNDFDCVEESNLHRQVIHREKYLGELKTVSAKHALHEINPACTVLTIDYQLEDRELLNVVGGVDIVLDCSDNLDTRHAINRACAATRTPLIFGAALRLEGQLACFNLSKDSPCLKCIYSNDAIGTDDCENEGVLGTVPGIVGGMQALAGQLILTANAIHLDKKLFLFDALTLQWQTINAAKNPICTVCAD